MVPVVIDYQLIVVALLVGLALAYTARKAWNLVRPTDKGAGCGCGTASTGCGGCPLTKT